MTYFLQSWRLLPQFVETVTHDMIMRLRTQLGVWQNHWWRNVTQTIDEAVSAALAVRHSETDGENIDETNTWMLRQRVVNNDIRHDKQLGHSLSSGSGPSTSLSQPGLIKPDVRHLTCVWVVMIDKGRCMTTEGHCVLWCDGVISAVLWGCACCAVAHGFLLLAAHRVPFSARTTALWAWIASMPRLHKV